MITPPAHDAPTLLERLILGVGLLVIAAQIVGAFVGLDASSFWIDELYTAWAIAPADWPSAWSRILMDSHPPVYAMTLKTWASVVGSSDAGLRAFSAVCASLAIAVMFFGVRRRMSLQARVLTSVIAVSSTLWLYQSQNARLYGLGLLLASALAVFTLDLAERAREARLRVRDHVALLVLAFVAAFTHFYLFLAVGAVYAVLIVSSRRRGEQVMLAACGTTILISVATFARLMLTRTMIDVEHGWFKNDPAVFVDEIHDGFASQFGKTTSFFLAMAVVALVLRLRSLLRTGEGRRRLGVLAQLVAPPVMLIVGGILVSLLIAPSFSQRNIGVAAPWAWLAAGALYDLLVMPLQRPWRVTLLCLLVGGAAVGGREILDRQTPTREEWRDSARYVSGLSQCSARPIPVMYPLRGRSTPGQQAAIRFGYRRYLAAPLSHALPIVGTAEGPTYTIAPDLAPLLAARLRGEDPCPVLMWAVHGQQDEAKMIAAIRRATNDPATPIAVKRFQHYRLDRHFWFAQARVLIVAPKQMATR